MVAGLGVACLSRAAVARELAAGSLAEVRVALHIQRWFRIVTRANERPGRLLETLLGWLREQALA